MNEAHPRIAERFARETANHQMTVLHNDGLYRHLRFRNPKDRAYWFDLITVPGTLTFQGDGDAYVFSRTKDMFEFFRGPVGQINPQYWAEKLTSGRERVKTYDQETFEARVKEAFVDAAHWGDVPAGTGKALREEVLNNEEIYYESGARAALDAFEHKGFEFCDTWEWDFKGYDWWFLWACQAIVWGIAYHDSGTRPSLPVPEASTPAAPRTNEPKCRAVVDVQLPADVTA